MARAPTQQNAAARWEQAGDRAVRFYVLKYHQKKIYHNVLCPACDSESGMTPNAPSKF
jgi:hypothetical protein